MSAVIGLQKFGNQITILFNDGTRTLSYVSDSLAYPVASTNGVKILQEFGDQIAVKYIDGTIDLAIRASSEYWIVNGSYVPPVLWEWPLNTSLWMISTYFTSTHDGIDITGHGVDGQPLWAISNGTVDTVGTGYSYGAGNWVSITHGDGTRSQYKHLNATPLVTVGQNLVRGFVIGYVGSTGDSTGPHLHFQCMAPNAVDPLVYMSARGRTFGEVQTS